MVGEVRFFNLETNSYDPAVPLVLIDETKIGVEKFVACAAGETGTGGPLRLYIGRPGIIQDVIIYNFAIK